MSVSASLSVGAAAFASVLLASRLPDPAHTFALMVFSLEVRGSAWTKGEAEALC